MIKENKRVLSLRLNLAFLNTTHWGWFKRRWETRCLAARDVDDCPACGLPIEVNDEIVLADRLQTHGWVERWIHSHCPIEATLAEVMDVRSNGRAVSHVGRVRRPTNCGPCHRRIGEGELSFREDLLDGTARYLCETCAREART